MSVRSNGPSRELYAAIVAADYWLATRLGKCQSILMHYVVKHAGTLTEAQRAALVSSLVGSAQRMKKAER